MRVRDTDLQIPLRHEQMAAAREGAVEPKVTELLDQLPPGNISMHVLPIPAGRSATQNPVPAPGPLL